AGSRRGHHAAPAARDRNAAIAQAHRRARDRPAAPRRARPGRSHRPRARPAGRPAGQYRRRTPVIERLRQLWKRRGRKPASVRDRDRDWRLVLKRRSVVAAGVLAFWAFAIETRLFYLQVVNRSELVDRAERQQLRTIKPAAKRGDIVDRHGHVLATSVD